MTDELTRLKELADGAIKARNGRARAIGCDNSRQDLEAWIVEDGRASLTFRQVATPELILSLIARLEGAEEALKPFADFIAGNAGDVIPDNFQISKGSSFAKKQITAKDCRAAYRALKSNPT